MENKDLEQVYNKINYGKPTAICITCGKEFNQQLKSNSTYSAFKNCYSCKAKLSQKSKLDKKNKKKESDNNEYDQIPVKDFTIDYEPLYEQQKEIFESDARIIIFAAGSRAGKDVTCGAKAWDYHIKCTNEVVLGLRPKRLNPPVYGWIIVPVDDMVSQIWEDFKALIPLDLLDKTKGKLGIEESNKIIHTIYGGKIEVKSGYDPEKLVSVGLDWAWMTEFARFDRKPETAFKNIFQRVNSPHRGINGKGGIILINSSPVGKGFFYQLWLRGQSWHDTYSSLYKSWKASTWDNPTMAEKRYELYKDNNGNELTLEQIMKNDLGERIYNQDILAEFQNDKAGCFQSFQEKCIVSIPSSLKGQERLEYINTWKSPLLNEQYIIGYDPASLDDHPVLVIIEKNTGRLMKAVDMLGSNWDVQYVTIAYYSVLYNNAPCLLSKTGHESCALFIEKEGVKVITLNEQGHNKENFIIHLEHIVQNGELKVLDDGSEENNTLIRQMKDYSKTLKGYSNVEEPHDDYVSALYIAFSPSNPTKKTLPLVGIIRSVGGKSYYNHRGSAL